LSKIACVFCFVPFFFIQNRLTYKTNANAYWFALCPGFMYGFFMCSLMNGFFMCSLMNVLCFTGFLCVRLWSFMFYDRFYVFYECFMPSFMRVFYAVLCVFYLVCFFLIYFFVRYRSVFFSFYFFLYILFFKKKKNI
jgi:hypothetical protein